MGYSQSNKASLKQIDLSDATQVNSGGASNTQTLLPPVGKIYQIIDIGYNAPDPAGGGASSAGTHYLEISYTGSYASIGQVISDFGNVVKINVAGFVGTSESPSSEREQFHLIHKTSWATVDLPLLFKYTNDTDKHQAGTRTLIITVKEYNEG